jgi:hypothetical protein
MAQSFHVLKQDSLVTVAQTLGTPRGRFEVATDIVELDTQVAQVFAGVRMGQALLYHILDQPS